MTDPNQHKPTPEQLWEQDRALLAEHGASHIETICAVAARLRREGRASEADELDQQCARMQIITMPDAELVALYERTDGKSGHRLADLLAFEIERRATDG